MAMAVPAVPVATALKSDHTGTSSLVNYQCNLVVAMPPVLHGHLHHIPIYSNNTSDEWRTK